MWCARNANWWHMKHQKETPAAKKQGKKKGGSPLCGGGVVQAIPRVVVCSMQVIIYHCRSANSLLKLWLDLLATQQTLKLTDRCPVVKGSSG